MKTTDKDSNIKPTNDAVESEKLVNKPAEQQPVLESGVEFSQETADVAAGEQLDLALPESQIVAMADNAEDKESKRKEKKDQLEQDNAEQVAQSADEPVVDSEQSDAAGEEADDTSEVQGEVAEALAEQSVAKGFGVYLSQLSTQTLVLGSLGILGAATYYRNKDDFETPVIGSGETAQITENSGAGQVIYTASLIEGQEALEGITFSLEAGSDSALAINATTGEVSLSVDPLHYNQSSYSFSVSASDANGNVSEPRAVVLTVIETLPQVAEVALTEDAGTADDGISNNGEITVSGIKLGAKWEYSTDNGLNWVLGSESSDFETATFNLPVDGDYQILVRQSNTAGMGPMSPVLTVTIDTVAPELLVLNSSVEDGTITAVFSELLASTTLSADGFQVTQGGETVEISSVAVDGSSVVLTAEGLTDSALQVSYTPGANSIQDVAGNTVPAFTQMVVSDGYIRDAEVYADTNNDGIADESELIEGVTSDALGQLVISGEYGDAQIIIKGGINVDTGAVNQLELTAPAGYSVINPLSTLVQEIIASDETQTVDQAETVLSDALGITLGEGEDLSSYDPISDVSENAVANRVATLQIATVLAIAAATDDSDTSDIEAVVLENLVELVTSSTGKVSLDEETLGEILSDDSGVSLVSSEDLTVVTTAVDAMETIKQNADSADGPVDLESVLAEIIEVQAVAIDSISPAAPDLQLAADSNSGVSNADALTNDLNPVITVQFDTQLTDGSAVIAGDTVQLFDGNNLILSYVLQQNDIDAGLYSTELSGLADGSEITASVEDIAGNISDLSVSISIDTASLAFASSDTAAAIDENSVAQIIYTATVDGDDLWKFELSEDSDSALLIDAQTGVVTLSADPDFEVQPQYSFTVVATDNAGNKSEQAVTLDVNNLDEIAPTVTSDDTAVAVDENSGAELVIYTATADDSLDISAGVTFSLTEDSDAALSIDASTGAVTLATDPDHETQAQYSFAVIATDAAGNASEAQSVTLDINDRDDTAPTITSAVTAEAIDENSGAGQVIYTVTDDDSADVADTPIAYSLAEGSDAALSIDAETGAVTLTTDPDHETQSQYSFAVVATDAAGNASEAQSVTLDINDLDDTAPTITSAVTAEAIDENSGAGQVIYTATADDSADVADTPIAYSLAEGSDAALSIDASTGAVTLATDPDHETQAQYSFSVIATDAAGNASEAQSVTLDINDRDDTAPIISSAVTAVAIDENSGAGQVIYTVTADDSADVADTPIAYSLAEGSDAALSINAETGAVTLTIDPDHETQSQYSFAVIATDAAGNASDAQSVTLDINDLDDAAPTVTSGATAVAIDENSGAGQVIYTATSTDLGDDVADKPIAYSLAEGSDAALSIDAVTGEVSLATDPDHETQSQYSFSVIATDAAGNASEAQSVTLDITDLDDTAPTITSAVTAQAIDENSGAGQVIYTVTADDSADVADTPIAYSLAEGSDAALSIDASTGTVTLATDPDHETQSQFSFSVIATDAAGNASEAQSVTLDINDLDDTAPTITSAVTAEAIDENSGAGQVIYTATADDSADVADTPIAYSLAEGSDAALSIDAETGAVTLAADPDHETQSQYSFAVVATDAAGNASEAQSVTLDINNLDDTAPIITSAVTAEAIDENSGAGQVIYTVTADDSADVADTPIAYSLAEGSDAALSIDSVTGEVSLATDPDHETQSQYSFAVIATDAAGNASEAQSVTLDINDRDDTAPIISSAVTAVAIDENSGAGQVIYTVTADDSADVADTPIAYSLAEGSDAALSINAETGAVTLTIDPDHETQSQYSFAVIATDAAGNASDAQSVTLDINDLDDAAPTVTSGATAVAIDENSGAGQVIYTATSTDLGDDVADTPIAYSLAEGSDAALSIDAETGAVTLATDPDHETQSQYSFAVIATDAAGNASEAQSVTLDINDRDDTAPIISSAVTAVAIDENSGAGQVIYTVTADDSADVADTPIAYSLAEGSDAALSINAETGAVTLTIDPDHETQSQYSFAVIATDAAGNASDAQSVTLDINDLDDAAPTVTSGATAVAIDENSGAGQVIYTATSTDLGDDVADTPIAYSLAEGSDAALSIDAVTGAVTLATNSDHETQSQYSFSVIATDAAGNASEAQSVRLDINNLDEVSPAFTISASQYEVNDGTATGQVIFTAEVDDTGDISNGVTFSLLEGDLLDDALSINAATGEVTLNESPDFDTKSSYSFTVLAEDGVNTGVVKHVTLNVVNVDEVAPTFDSGEAGVAVDENSGEGQVVYTANATDTDFNVAGITFTLADETLGYSIDAYTGVVTTNADFVADFDSVNGASQSFTVVATDVEGNASEQLVTIAVNNLDEVAPTIDSGESAAIDENSGAGQVIYTAIADDSQDISAGVSFSLAADSDAALSINAGTGKVTLSLDTDFEVQPSYSFTVIASDGVNEDVQQTVTLTVNDLDEIAPTITSGASGTAVDENSGAGQVVYSATATDGADTSDGFSFRLADDSLGFSIDAVGKVTTNADFSADFEDAQSQRFTVIATDVEGNASKQLVTIAVNNLDEVAPTFDSGESAAIDENSGAGQVIYTAIADDSQDISAGVSFSLAAGSDDALSIDASTGAVTLATDPDFNGQTSYSFTVIASDGVNEDVQQTVTLTVNDLDEIAPTITSGASGTAVDENSGAGQVVYSATATDGADTSDGFSFSLADDRLGFSIDAEGKVTTNADFSADFEDAQSQRFTVIATDVEGNASKQLVTIAVNNLDEVAPTFDSGDTGAAVDENSGADQVVYTATATDNADTSVGFSFSLADNNLGFSIDADSGVVITNADFSADFEVAESQSFTVVATDVAGNSSEQVVTIAVNNLDEIAPTITSGDSAAVLESSGADALVYRALADDSADVSAGVTFSLSEGSDTALSINAETGEVTLTDEPDFAAKPSYSFTVIADDGVNQSQKAVTLSVVDEDGEAPVFTSSATVAIDENIGENQVIYTAITNDESLVNYSLSEDSDISLSINSASGAVTLATDPDSEAQSEYNFTVIATDIANNISQQTVTVSINDLDDAAPTVTSGAVADAIDENSGAGQVIYTVTADDSGDDVAATPITYSLTEDSDTGLSIDALTGAVSLTADPDHESQSEYSFAVVATDAAGNASEAQSVTLNINDLDDAAPTITSGAVASIIDENIGAGQVIYTATADDSADISAGFSFSLTQESDAGLTIDASSGAVSLTADPDHETQSQYSFAVIATDAAGNASEAQSVTLDITDLDDAAPTVTSGATAVSIDENSGAGQVIYTATSTDLDDDVADTPIAYSLAEGSDAALTIDGSTGVVTLATDPDHETQTQYSFTVVATDAAGNASEAQSVTLDINNLDDTAPTITSAETAEAIDENSDPGQVIYTATADDSQDISAGVSFSLAEGSDTGLTIDSSSGEVTLQTIPNYEAKSQYNFTVVASDGVNNDAEQSVTLNINNLDEVAPTITSSDTASVDEVYADLDDPASQTYDSFNGVVYTASATDTDYNNAEVIEFSLAEGADTALSIDASTGAVTLNTADAELSYQAQSEYIFDIIATDATGNSSDTQTVTLTVAEAKPKAAEIVLPEGTTNPDGTFTQDNNISVSNIKEGASWQYRLNNESSWIDGSPSGTPTEGEIVIDEDGDYQIDVRVINAQGESTSLDSPVSISVDKIPPTAEFVSADSDPLVQAISVNYSEVLDSDYLPNASDYVIEQNGNPLTVTAVNLNPEDSSILVLSINESFNSGALNFTYNASENASDLVTDLAGNQLVDGFTQMIVSDGYIRGAQVYIDVNGDGIADESELREQVTSDAFGQIILTDEFLNAAENTDSNGNPYQVIVKGGVNMDSGAPNEIELTAPAGYSVINPLSTLVQEIASSLEVEVDTAGMSEEEIALATQAAKDAAKLAAESSLAETLGISLEEGSSLGSYDPQSDNNVANRVIATQIATVLAVASSTETTGSEGAETAALASLANTISSAEGAVTLDSSTMGEVLDGVVVDTAALDALNLAVDAMEAVKNSEDSDAAFAAIVQAQAKAIDTVAPQAPQPELSAAYDSGISDSDALTNVNNPVVRFVLDTLSTDGTAVVAGDQLEILNTGVSQGVFVLTAQHIEDGYYDYTWVGELLDGDRFISATVTDLAGNLSYVSTFVFEVDTAPLVITSDESANIDENSDADQIVYTATTAGLDFWKFELSSDSDPALTIDTQTGVVTLSADPDFEAQSLYSFTIIAFDNAGNTSDKTVTLNINNLDEVAPTVISGDTAVAIDENSGASQVIYTATADDTADISDGFTFSLAEGSDAAVSIDSVTGAVTLATDPDHEAQSQYSFAVIATDAAGNVSDAQSVTLDINDLDEVAPTVTSGATAVAIVENSGADQVIYTATADDSADISNGFTFSLTEGSDAALSIDSVTGEVSLATDPDHETQSQYSFAVIATDAAGNASTEQAVTLDINDLDEVAPTVTSGDTAVAIDENSGAEQVIYTATADDTADISEGFTFSLAEGSDAALSIDSATGDVTLSIDPDHETQSQYSFDVMATDVAGNSSEKIVTVDINNLDETAPTITSDSGSNIDENSGVGQVIYTATSDDSSDISGGVTYSLVDGTSYGNDDTVPEVNSDLSINSETGEVTLAANPDYETESEYSFSVVATDAAGNVSDTQEVTVSVNNLDEVAPTITSVATGTAVDENSGAEQAVYTASATDTDFNGAEDITYSLADETLGFSIDADSGDVTTNADFSADFEDAQSQSFTVVATDVAGNASEQVVTIAVTNLDEVAPTITSGDTASVDENSGAEQAVYTASATDTDFNGAEDITYSLADETLGFSIDADSGDVTTNADFSADFEDPQSQSFTVVATDVAGNSSEKIVTVDINNLDETAPTITSDAGSNIDENSGAGQVIYTATSDDSSDISGGVTYSLVDGTSYGNDDSDGEPVDTGPLESEVSIPALVAATQHVYVSSSTKSEDGTQETIVISYNADDTTTTGLGLRIHFDSSQLSVANLEGVLSQDNIFANSTAQADADNYDNDASTDMYVDMAWASLFGQWPGSAPTDLATLTFDIAEGASGSSAINFTASSNASGYTFAGQAHNIAISSESDTGNQEDTSNDNTVPEVNSDLSINSETGEVTLAANPDYETESEYSFSVVATDAAGNVSDTQEVTVSVNNLDEVAPTITSVATGTAVDENSGAEQAVYTASATDTDFNGAEDITYSLADETLGFSIDADSGDVTTNADFSANFEEAQSQSFTVVATDVAGNASEQVVTIAVNNLDEVAPTITSVATGTAVDENSGAEQAVYTASATDTDFNGAEDITYSLADETLGFSIDADSGDVTTNADFSADFEDAQSQSFTVVATDVAGNASEQVVTIAVTNLDEVAPTITSVATGTAVDENSGAEQAVYTASATDTDFNGAEDITYSLADETLGFSIDADSGDVTTNADFSANFEEAQSQSFTVVATDVAGNASEQVVTIGVNNLDEVAPTITSVATGTAVDENSGAEQAVYTASATDTDFNGAEDITYSLADETLGFSIDADSGDVTTNADFSADFEDAQSQSFTVVATDVAGNASEQVVTIDINNIDDTAPVLTSASVTTISDYGADGFIYLSESWDVDSPSGEVEYAIAYVDAETINILPGHIIQTFTDNGDGTHTLTLTYDDSFGGEDLVGEFIESYDFSLKYNQEAVTLLSEELDIEGEIFTSYASFPEPAVGLTNVTADGEIAVAVISPTPINSDEYLAKIDFTFNPGVNAALFQVDEVNFNNSQYGVQAAERSISNYQVFSDLTINPETGKVSVSDVPTIPTAYTFTFDVIATDYEDNSEATQITVELDPDPVINSSNIAQSINEGTGADQIIYVASLNKDLGAFELVSQSEDVFDLDTSTGEVTLTVNPDFESMETPEYSFTLSATDSAGITSANHSVTLSIINVDDTDPSFTSELEVFVDENIDVNEVFYTATADDSEDVSDGVTFSLNSSTNNDSFNLDEITGELSFKESPNFEDKNTYQVEIMVFDLAGNKVLGQVDITINNIDEVQPEITSDTSGTAVDENSGADQVIYTATSTDLGDDVADTPIAYSLVEGSDAALSIDSVTGEVSLATDPDHETQSQYSFAVIATDAAGNASEAQSVTLDINNLDEAAPIITSAAETVVVDTDETNPVIYTATADDSADISGGVSFSLNDTTVYANTSSAIAESMVTIPDLLPASQHVYVSSSTKSEDGTQETVVVSYNADDTTTTGLGLRIHFDSSALSASDIATLMTNDLLVNAVVESDDNDLDGDASTDTYVAFGWASLFGAWPGSAPADLASITFDIAEGATGSSAINFTASSNAAGFTFDDQSHEVAITGEAVLVESQLSIDSATGEVTLSGTLDPDVQSEYSFTVTAADAAGNLSDLDVVLDIIEPPMVDAAMVVVVDGDLPATPIYQASANIDNVSYQITDLTQYPDAGSGSGSAESQISIPELSAATQHVYVSSSTKSEDGTQETVVVSYNADDTTTTGLGLRIHFDSSVLSASDITTLMTNDLLVNAVVESDDSDLDGDASTDTYVQFGWASLFGAWPGSAPVDLASITFDIAEGATGSSAINFSTSSNAAGFAFDGQDHNLVLAAEAVVPAAELVIDNAAGTVSLDAAANSDVMPAYSFTVDGTDADGDAVGSQTVPVVVVDQVVNADASSYTGTADADVFALADGSAEITSGAGEDDFVLDPAFASASHTITDFESGVDAIDISAALVAAGYNTSDNVPTQLGSADMSADILDLVNGDDSSLDNLFGATYDDASNTLTVFADSDSSAGSTDMDSFQITLDDSATVEDDDIVANLSPFIA